MPKELRILFPDQPSFGQVCRPKDRGRTAFATSYSGVGTQELPRPRTKRAVANSRQCEAVWNKRNKIQCVSNPHSYYFCSHLFRQWGLVWYLALNDGNNRFCSTMVRIAPPVDRFVFNRAYTIKKGLVRAGNRRINHTFIATWAHVLSSFESVWRSQSGWMLRVCHAVPTEQQAFPRLTRRICTT